MVDNATCCITLGCMGRKANKGNETVAVGYVRVSKDEQELGPEAQRAAIETWATRNGVSVVAWHVDHGVCGATELTDRPGLVAALGSLRSYKAGLLVVAKRDRLARDVAVAALVDRAVDQAGARVMTAEGVANGSSPADSFLRNILDAAAAYERDLIRSRTRDALAAKRARGERAGEVPFGFRADSAGKLHDDPTERAVIAQVTELRRAGLSQRKIVAQLRAVGTVSPRSGRPLSQTQVCRLLRRTEHGRLSVIHSNLLQPLVTLCITPSDQQPRTAQCHAEESQPPTE